MISFRGPPCQGKELGVRSWVTRGTGFGAMAAAMDAGRYLSKVL